jgi:DNA-binding response OmpR family regulator
MFRPPLRVRFGPFEIDEKTGELRKDGTKIRLQEQPLQILQILAWPRLPGSVTPRYLTVKQNTLGVPPR